MMKRNFKVGRYFGIDVYLHYSWFLIFLLLAWGLSTGFFPEQFPGRTGFEYWGIGIFSSFLLFLSVLAHELSHSLVGMRHGIKVDRITLFFFGGVAGMHEQKMSPKSEFQMAIAGPAFSIVLAFVFLAVYNLTSFFYVAAVSSYLFRINLIIAVFNMMPGFPLDGGRVFRSILWYWTKDFKKATHIATTAGKVLAYIMIFIGFSNVFTGNFAGIWFVLLGFFLLMLSTLSYKQIVIKDALAGVRAGEFVTKKFVSVKPGTSLRDVVVDVLLKKDVTSVLVMEDGRFLGVLVAEQVQQIPKKEWKGIKASDAMVGASRVGKVRLMTGAYNTLVKMLKGGLDFLPVIEKKKLVGIVRRQELLRYVKFRTTKEKFEKMGFDMK
ncbi:site-2 protease family protein [Nanoarchaeota archaeon]